MYGRVEDVCLHCTLRFYLLTLLYINISIDVLFFDVLFFITYLNKFIEERLVPSSLPCV